MMRDLLEALSRLVAVFRKRALDRDFEDEFAAHLESLTARNEQRGLPRDEARRQAILQMGGLNATRDFHREARGLPRVHRITEALGGFRRDLVHAARSLARAPGFTVVCVTSLSIGMAAVIAIPYFARLLFAAPAGVNTAGLIELLMTPRGPLRIELGEAAVEGWSYPDYADLRDAETGMMISAPVALSYAQRHSDTALWVKVVDYLGETYTARPSDASDYVFFAGDVISLRIEVVNRGSEAITHDDPRGGAGPAQSFSFDTPSEVRASICSASGYSV